MRLTEDQVKAFVEVLTPHLVGSDSELRLYGSRVDDRKKGGDIDLLLIVPEDLFARVTDIKNPLIVEFIKKPAIGDQKIDLLIIGRHQAKADPFVQSILPESILLKSWQR